MDSAQNLPKDAESYIAHVRQLAAMTNAAMDEVENKKYTRDEMGLYESTIERLSGAVKTIADLRGDTNVFLGSRPEGLQQYQKEMYQLENELRARLSKIEYKFLYVSTQSASPKQLLNNLLFHITTQFFELFDFPNNVDEKQTHGEQLVFFTNTNPRSKMEVELNQWNEWQEVIITKMNDVNPLESEFYRFAANKVESYKEDAVGVGFRHWLTMERFRDDIEITIHLKDHRKLKITKSLDKKRKHEDGTPLTMREIMDLPVSKTEDANEENILPIIQELVRIEKNVQSIIDGGEYISKTGHKVTI